MSPNQRLLGNRNEPKLSPINKKSSTSNSTPRARADGTSLKCLGAWGSPTQPHSPRYLQRFALFHPRPFLNSGRSEPKLLNARPLPQSREKVRAAPALPSPHSFDLSAHPRQPDSRSAVAAFLRSAPARRRHAWRRGDSAPCLTLSVPGRDRGQH